MPLLVSIIVNFRSERWLPRCIETLYTGGSEGCILVDNDRLDPPVLNSLKKIYPGLEYIPCGKNIGFSRANNIGIEHALQNGADYIGWLVPCQSTYKWLQSWVGLRGPVNKGHTGEVSQDTVWRNIRRPAFSSHLFTSTDTGDSQSCLLTPVPRIRRFELRVCETTSL